jgi:hypothetical protein
MATRMDTTGIDFTIFFLQIGLTSYLEMFKRAPESLSMFPFLKHLSNEDLEFYSQLRDHAVRVTGVLSMMIRQVSVQCSRAEVSNSN